MQISEVATGCLQQRKVSGGQAVQAQKQISNNPRCVHPRNSQKPQSIIPACASQELHMLPWPLARRGRRSKKRDPCISVLAACASKPLGCDARSLRLGQPWQPLQRLLWLPCKEARKPSIMRHPSAVLKLCRRRSWKPRCQEAFGRTEAARYKCADTALR